MATANHDPAASLNLQEMLRVMEAATGFRKDRELVEVQLNLDVTKALLRERLLAGAREAGENVTADEVDKAVDRYYRDLHRFRDPPPGLMRQLAYMYVLRRPIGILVAFLSGLLLLTWALFLSPRGPMTITGRTQQRIDRLLSEIDASRKVVLGLAATDDRDVEDRTRGLGSEIQVDAGQRDFAKLEDVRDRLKAMESVLREEYTISVVSEPGKKSGIDRYYRDQEGKRLSGYYVIVEARTSRGEILPRQVKDAETGKVEAVTTWGERVPKEVYDRLVKDKRADGILDETAFARKSRGQLEEKIVMPGSDGKPLSRLGQITKW